MSKVIKQLEGIAEYSESFIDDNPVWSDDIEAVNAAIRIIKSNKECKAKYFWIGITLGVLITLAFHFLWIIKVGF